MKYLTEEQQEHHDKYGHEYYYEPHTDTMEFSQVRTNMMKDRFYTPYCIPCPRLIRFNQLGSDDQMTCPSCGVKTEFPKEFIDRFKAKNGIMRRSTT